MTSSLAGRTDGRAVAGRRAVAASVALVAFAVPSAAPAQPAPSASLDPVVVTANRTPQPLSSVIGDVSVVDRETIERSGAVGVADVLARLPGIEFTRNGGPGGVTGVFVRGAESRHTAVYIDGVRVDSQAVGGAPWEQIPLDRIDRIEVLRGPAAAVYGSDAVAGVVQLFTRRGEGAARPTASLMAGSYDTVQAQAGVAGSARAFDYSLSASHGRSGGFDSRTDGANPDRDGWRRSSLQARAGFQLSREHRLDASLLASNLRSGYDGFAPGVDDLNLYALRTGSLAWQGRWSDAATTRLQLGQTASAYESRPDFYRTETTLRNATLLHEQRLGGGNLLTATLERREDELRNAATAFAPALEGRRSQDAVGVGWRGDFGAHGVQAHLRRDRDSEFGGRNTGSLAWGWAFAPRWRVTAAAATSFRAPTLYQRFSQYGNPSLVPEAGRNVEAGLRWADAGSEASLAVWRNRLTDLIVFGAPGPCADAFGCYVNVGEARLQGATLAGRTRLRGVTLRGSLDWHDPRNTVADKVLPRRARRLATLGAEVQAAGERFEDADNTQRLGGYGLVSLLVGKALAPGLTLEGRLDNVGGKRYELARGYATPGRHGWLTLRWALR